MRVFRSIPGVAVLGLLWAACGGHSKQNQNNNGCPQGFEARGSACVPIFDDCTGPVEVPVLGGGCRPVGVTQCGAGFLSDGQGGCLPVLPEQPCPAGTLPVIGQTQCQPVGVPQCEDGFVSDGEGGCEAILPVSPCSANTMERLGETECQPIGDCGDPPWGPIVPDATTIFVDASYGGGNSDGSQSAPFLTVGEALSAAEPGGQIAVAEGQYVERLIVGKPVRLAGRCAALVTLRGTTFLGQPRPPVAINSAGSGTAVRGVTLTGDGEGLLINEAEDVTVERVQILDTGSYGVNAFNGAQARLEQVLVAGCTEEGIFSVGATVDIHETVVRGTRPVAGGTLGRGIEAICVPNGFCGTVTVTRSLIHGNREYGILVAGPDAALSSTVVRDTLPNSAGRIGRGIEAACSSDEHVCGTLDVTGSVISGNTDRGIMLGGVQASVASTVVKDTEPDGSGLAGRGIEALCHPVVGECGHVTLSQSVVSGNTEMGIGVFGVDAEVASTVVRDTQPQQNDGSGGRGIEAQCNATLGTCSTLSLSGSLVQENRDLAVMLVGADADIAFTVVRDTQPEQSSLDGGIGIEAQCDADMGRCSTLTVTSSLFERNAAVGIGVFGGDTTIDSVVVQDTQARQSNGWWGRGINAQCSVQTGRCGSLTVTGSLIRRNRSQGIFVAGVDAIIASTVVADTLDQESDRRFGRGIEARCHVDPRACGSMEVIASLVRSSFNLGVYLSGVPAILEDVAIVDTVPNMEGLWRDDFGQALWAMCDDDTSDCATLQMTSCLLHSSYAAGLAAKGIPGFIESSLIDSVRPRVLDEAFGYGMQIEGLEGLQPLNFDVRFCVIQGFSLAGILYDGAGGTIAGSLVRGGQYPVAASVGSLPSIADNNDLSGTVQDDLYWGNLDPSPAPSPDIPTGAE